MVHRQKVWVCSPCLLLYSSPTLDLPGVHVAGSCACPGQWSCQVKITWGYSCHKKIKKGHNDPYNEFVNNFHSSLISIIKALSHWLLEFSFIKALSQLQSSLISKVSLFSFSKPVAAEKANCNSLLSFSFRMITW